MAKKKCKICNKKTSCVVNINFEAVSICDECCTTIAVQQVQFWAENSKEILEHLQKKEK